MIKITTFKVIQGDKLIDSFPGRSNYLIYLEIVLIATTDNNIISSTEKARTDMVIDFKKFLEYFSSHYQVIIMTFTYYSKIGIIQPSML